MQALPASIRAYCLATPKKKGGRSHGGKTTEKYE
jgi:hypothetical protein